MTNNYDEFLFITKESVKLFPGNEDIQAYYIMALLKTRNYEDAYNISLDQLVSNEFKPLLAEAMLYYENKNREKQTLTQYIESKKDPAFFEYLSNLLDDKELRINAALLWAKNGDLDKAYSMIDNSNDINNAELLALLAYDSGRQSESLIRLLELPISDSIKYDNLLLTADLFYLKENFSRSRFYYEQALEINNLNANPYINISSIYLETNNFKKAISIVEKGIAVLQNRVKDLSEEKNSDNVNLIEDESIEEINLANRLKEKNRDDLLILRNEYKELILLVHYLYKEIGSDEAIRVIEDYRRDFPNDVKIELLEMRETNSRANPELFLSRLWKLLNKDTDNREVSEFLIWYLLGLENFNDIKLVLERSENRHSEDNWTEYYRGILYALNGEYHKALNSFESPGIEVDSWEVYYNTALIEVALQNFPEALVLFNKSIISINQISHLNNKDIYLSKIKTKMAQVLINLNDTDEAIRVLNSAFELDPNNYSSDLLKSIYLNLKENE